MSPMVMDAQARLEELQPLLEEAEAIRTALLLDYMLAEDFVSLDNDVLGVK